MAKQKLSAKQTRKTLATVLRYLRNYRLHIIASVLLAAISVGLTLYIPIVIGDAIDHIIDQGNVHFDAIVPLLLRVALCAGIIALAQWLMSRAHAILLSELQICPLRFTAVLTAFVR
jgi:ATP-binding cassette subfamily B protein